ncbi:hypothetical protein Tco_1013722 [Tanacetum coccineum]
MSSGWRGWARHFDDGAGVPCQRGVGAEWVMLEELARARSVLEDGDAQGPKVIYHWCEEMWTIYVCVLGPACGEELGLEGDIMKRERMDGVIDYV